MGVADAEATESVRQGLTHPCPGRAERDTGVEPTRRQPSELQLEEHKGAALHLQLRAQSSGREDLHRRRPLTLAQDQVASLAAREPFLEEGDDGLPVVSARCAVEEKTGVVSRPEAVKLELQLDRHR
jgi:hypothetical protein